MLSHCWTYDNLFKTCASPSLASSTYWIRGLFILLTDKSWIRIKPMTAWLRFCDITMLTFSWGYKMRSRSAPETMLVRLYKHINEQMITILKFTPSLIPGVGKQGSEVHSWPSIPYHSMIFSLTFNLRI